MRKVDANLSNLHNAWRHNDPHHVDRVLSLYIYCTETLMGLLSSANKAIGSGVTAYIFFE